MSELTLKARVRQEVGSNANRKLRKEELIPAVLYQKGEENQLLTLVAKEFDKVLSEAGTSTIVTLDIEGAKKKVLVKDFQRHSYKNMFVHVDLMGVNMDEKLKVNVPVVLLNRDDIYLQPSILMQALNEVEVECLPSDIPQQAEIDVQNMQYGDTYLVKDLDIASDESITILTDLEEVVCSLQEPREEEVSDDEEVVDAADVEVIGEKEEGEEE
ncbi:MAG: 50S ribosomal protein L25 [Tissierellia bacterium]|nr:50S ribosomal protein L25 [Tissierellia bacterium]